jgi:hypothetical protein
MPLRLTGQTRVHLEKARAAAISAVEVYNRPGSVFRTPHYLVLMTIAWTKIMLILILIFLLLFGGGGGYYAYGPTGGVGIGGVILIVLIVLLLSGRISLR